MHFTHNTHNNMSWCMDFMIDDSENVFDDLLAFQLEPSATQFYFY